MNKEPVLVIADILSHELQLGQDRIFIYNDGRQLPKDSGLYIVLLIDSRPPYGTKTEYKEVNGVYCNVQSMNVAEKVTAQIVSKDTTARKRAYEVQMAMSSNYAIQQMEKYGFHISRIANVMDASFVEATTRMNRFDCEINILTAYEKVSSVDYYDTFNTEERFQA